MVRPANLTACNPNELWGFLQEDAQTKLIIDHSSLLKDPQGSPLDKIRTLGNILQAATTWQHKSYKSICNMREVNPNWNRQFDLQEFGKLARAVNQEALFIFSLRNDDGGLLKTVQLKMISDETMVRGIKIAVLRENVEELETLIPCTSETNLTQALDIAIRYGKKRAAKCLLENTSINPDKYFGLVDFIPLILASHNFTSRGLCRALNSSIVEAHFPAIKELLKCPNIPRQDLESAIDLATYYQVYLDAEDKFPPKTHYLFWDANKMARNQYLAENLPQEYKHRERPKWMYSRNYKPAIKMLKEDLAARFP